ncbi:uncharacterized protein DSM5745_03813 [Aspergillus mulundensis]|uniref:Letm1 RBD domain-containing protein n=1 Tax=Aspergillus mulundensis TaxID=1810919 RepID=A0A3D8SLV9_9EURO|nr:Uncharacterized protein DSM5745_03813 [Aspergillus mulundensis]RDW87171.1 Uncharacterized protein DSM5745_03813 [Aspergillus mulundensis]
MASIRTQRARVSHLTAQFPRLILTTPFLQQTYRYRFQHQLRASHDGKSHNRPPSTNPSEDVNPPPSTRPAEIETPAPLGPSASAGDKAKQLLAYGRAYLAFYKSGVKNVYHNYRASLPIRRSLGIQSFIPKTPPPKAFLKIGRGNGNQLKIKTSRSTFQLVHRAAYDARRMIPFTIVLIVCGEFTPLIVYALGNSITPFTCRIPKQIERHRKDMAENKSAALKAHAQASGGSATASTPEAGTEEELHLLSVFARPDFAREASAGDILTACAVFGLVESSYSYESLVEPLYRKRLARHAEYLAVDDKMIKSCGGVTAMDSAEVRIAVQERGGFGLPTGSSAFEAEMVERKWLNMWLKKSQPETALLEVGEVNLASSTGNT